MSWPVRTYKLATEVADAGLCCRKDGLTLAGIPLLNFGPFGFEPRSASELQTIFDIAYGRNSGPDAASSLPGLSSVADALNGGDLSRAMISSLLTRMPEVEADGLDRLAKVGSLLKANFNPAQSRNEHGQWSNENSSVVQAQIGIPIPLSPPLFPWPNRPKQPGGGFVFPPLFQNGTSSSANDSAEANDRTATITDDNPKICPDDSQENIAGRSERTLAYQEQITGLPRGWDVELNGVRFDGCDETTGTMLEAKGPGYLWGMNGVGGWMRWYTGIFQLETQMKNQSDAAGVRMVKWYVAEKPVAEYLKAFATFEGYPNIDVIWQAPRD